ncbi:hypothetical protein BJ508DRAFT_413388 [Ascobolus immersus RN42]|uniref:Uncharacterized protein n=1 Tax=Ascobolus immersus RN42 TaxID=1160509 RepID=A0A3N4IGY7_ASCIM|nr:hypothetical protein BJ508DRAFT_413388 [Ascobolus immersus RN42]
MASFVSLPADIHYEIVRNRDDPKNSLGWSVGEYDIYHLAQTCRSLRSTYLQIIKHEHVRVFCNPNLPSDYFDSERLKPEFSELIEISSWSTVESIIQQVREQCEKDPALSGRYEDVVAYLLSLSLMRGRVPYVRNLIALLPPEAWQLPLLLWLCYGKKLPDDVQRAILDCFLATRGLSLDKIQAPLDKDFLGPMSGFFLADVCSKDKTKIVPLLITLGADVTNPLVENPKNRHLVGDPTDKRTALVRLLDYVAGVRASENSIFELNTFSRDWESIASAWANNLKLLIENGADIRPLNFSLTELFQNGGNGWGLNTVESNPAVSIGRLCQAKSTIGREYFLTEALAILEAGGASKELLQSFSVVTRRAS